MICWHCESGSHRCVGFGCPCPPCAAKQPVKQPSTAQERPLTVAAPSNPWHTRLAGRTTDDDALCDGVLQLLTKLKEAA